MFTEEQQTFTEEQVKHLTELLKTRKGYVEIARLMGISYNTFKLYLANSDKFVGRVLLDKISTKPEVTTSSASAEV